MKELLLSFDNLLFPALDHVPRGLHVRRCDRNAPLILHQLYLPLVRLRLDALELAPTVLAKGFFLSELLHIVTVLRNVSRLHRVPLFMRSLNFRGQFLFLSPQPRHHLFSLLLQLGRHLYLVFLLLPCHFLLLLLQPLLRRRVLRRNPCQLRPQLFN